MRAVSQSGISTRCFVIAALCFLLFQTLPVLLGYALTPFPFAAQECFAIDRFRVQLLIACPALRIQFACVNRRADRTPRLAVVPTIGKAASSQVPVYVGESVCQPFLCFPHAELSHTGSVYDQNTI